MFVKYFLMICNFLTKVETSWWFISSVFLLFEIIYSMCAWKFYLLSLFEYYYLKLIFNLIYSVWSIYAGKIREECCWSCPDALRNVRLYSCFHEKMSLPLWYLTIFINQCFFLCNFKLKLGLIQEFGLISKSKPITLKENQLNTA